jgi:hypothetical protein
MHLQDAPIDLELTTASFQDYIAVVEPGFRLLAVTADIQVVRWLGRAVIQFPLLCLALIHVRCESRELKASSEAVREMVGDGEKEKRVQGPFARYSYFCIFPHVIAPLAFIAVFVQPALLPPPPPRFSLNSMDIDIVEERPRSSNLVAIDDAHPFDLDAYISNYTGRTAVDRLIHIIRRCPELAPRAFQLAVAQIQTLRDPMLYTLALSAYESHLSLGVPPAAEVAKLPPNWMEETEQKNSTERQKLEVELKTYTSNMIKESIRMAHRDLADHCRATGDHAGALKHYTKSREYCTTSQHVLDMCLSVLEVSVVF